NKTVEQATKPVTDIAGDSAAPVAEAVNNTTKAVTKTVENTTESVTGTVDSTTKTVTKTVVETTKPVTESLTDDKPLLEVDLSDDPAVKVNTGVVDVEVSKDPQVKVDTGVVDADVSNEPAVKVDVEAEEPDEPLIDTEDKDSVVKREREDARKEPVKKEVPVETDQSSIQISKAKNHIETILTKPVVVEKERAVKMEAPKNQNDQPSPPRKKMEPVLTTTTMNSTSQSSSTSGTSGQVTGSSSLWVFSEQYATAINFQKANMYEKNNLYYDQWLNAPPSQPPQDSLLFKSI
ncbi:hypothetical protein NQ095_13740, partial [Rossellomorea sp. SC111]|uniref:hypothetical protein n=1 Tax=Rossellomorea sp. SC111 TaxID=2968985 RepID=UPI00215A0DBB